VTDDDRGIPLADLPVGQWGRVCAPGAGAALSRRLLVLGFVPGTRIGMIRRAPFGGPLELELRGYRICLRRRQLDGLRVTLDDGEAAP
jgi:ferrous iron transport protein A